MDVMTANTANLDFHSYDANSGGAVNYDTRIQSTSGNGSVGSGSLSYYATQHTFTGTVNVPGLTSTGKLACGTNSVTCGTLT